MRMHLVDFTFGLTNKIIFSHFAESYAEVGKTERCMELGILTEE